MGIGVASGSVVSGRVTFGIPDTKTATGVDVRHDPLPAAAEVELAIALDDGTPAATTDPGERSPLAAILDQAIHVGGEGLDLIEAPVEQGLDNVPARRVGAGPPRAGVPATSVHLGHVRVEAGPVTVGLSGAYSPDFFAGSGAFFHAAVSYGAREKINTRSVIIQLPQAIDGDDPVSVGP